MLPWVDPVKGVERYFEFVQTAVDANRELAISWADAMGSVYGVVRDGAESISRLGPTRPTSSRTRLPILAMS